MSNEQAIETEEALATAAAVREALWSVEDPELRMSILELGLIYNVAMVDEATVSVTMTLTSPACPVGPLLESLVRQAALSVEGVETAAVEITFDPPWDPKVMASDDVKLVLGIW